MANPFSYEQIEPSSGDRMAMPARHITAVTASDSTEYDPPLRGIYIGGAGNVAVLPPDNTSAVTLTGVTAGSVYPVMCTKVMSTNTTATNIVGLR